MADVIKKATNKWTKGLVMDFSPENTGNEVLTNALNATLLTFNGNELSLQNDMGNARVETAFLPEGYIPVGTCEYGGIIYIVSYNPLEDKSLIGCFPSPERNISSEELGISNPKLNNSDFVDGLGKIINNTRYVLLKDDKLNPGDKFIISSTDDIYKSALKDLLKEKNGEYKPIENPIIALNVVSIEDSGKIVYLNSDVILYENNGYKYHILGAKESGNDLKPIDIDSYRNVVCSGYNVFKSKTSGKLAILAELIMIDSYSVTHSIKQSPLHANEFDIEIHTEITPSLTSDNYAYCPKLKYYYLQKSLGYLQVSNNLVSLFQEKDGEPTSKLNDAFLSTLISDIYKSTSSELKKLLRNTGKFNFPKSGYYHGNMLRANTKKEATYTKFYAGKYHRISKSQIIKNGDTELKLLKDYYLSELRANFYKYALKEDYTVVPDNADLDDNKDYYVKIIDTIYNNVNRDQNYHNDEVTLYKLITEPHVATKKEIEDDTIEKYIARIIDLYLPATKEQIQNWEREELWIKITNGFKENREEPKEDEKYYIKSTLTEWESIGTSINENQYTGVIYYFALSKDYLEATLEDLNKYWDEDTYPTPPLILYYKTQSESYVLATEEQKLNYKTYNIILYYKEEYLLVNDNLILGNEGQGLLFIVVPMDTYVSCETFTPNENDNYIEGFTKPEGTFPKDDPITLHKVADFIPESNSLEYGDVKFANITIPQIIHDNKYSFPFKYDYTVVPCMNYGRLDHLAVSNTIDFSKLYSFSKSDFNVWKYHIDENLLRLTFGAEIYDTIEENKVDALVLEFYDLRGFAGSLEICDKKSYSGIFTKLLSLNTVNTLSNKKIHNNNYITTFKRNAGIIQKDSKYYLNNKEVYYSGSEDGWRYNDEKGTSLSDADNDCGILYSNILYGVKTYLRVTDNTGYNFIPKTQFFLYTLPIHNSYYYTCDNFNELHYPKLDLMLTYKLLDNSNILPYNNDNIDNGYINKSNNSDSTTSSDDITQASEKIKNYLTGRSTYTSIETTRYYKCKGVTDLYLEVGLKKEYSDFNLQYDIDLIKYFSCNLQLVGNEQGKTFALQNKNNNRSEEEILNYNNLLDLKINKLGFDTNFSENKLLNSGDLLNMLFLYLSGSNPLKINYEFIIGYNINIDNIKPTDIKTTTVCALCHKQNGVYNYEDFGVYYLENLDEFDSTDNNGNPIEGDNERHYKSDLVFYSAGDAKNINYGICRQVKTNGTIMDQFRKKYDFTESAQQYSSDGLLYSGTPLKQVMPNIGKLAFCLPHIHGLSDLNGVSITYSEHGDNLIIHPYLNEDEDTTEFSKGCAPGVEYVVKSDLSISKGSKPMYDSPLCSMFLLTKQSVLYNSEFISTIPLLTNNSYTCSDWCYTMYAYDNKDGKLSECLWNHDIGFIFKGLQGYLLCKYNKKLITTMKNVYGYNKDYDTYSYNVGDVMVTNNDVAFVSQLISTNSKLDLKDGKLFNDFIYFGGINVSTYLENMAKYSNGRISITETLNEKTILKPQIIFKPNFTYCGSDNQGFLLTSLNYNIPTPKSISEELSFNTGNMTVVRHADESINFIKGIPNKHILYGWDSKNKKMILLDVKNYKIDYNGNLTFKDNANLIKLEESRTFEGSSLFYAGLNNNFNSYMGYEFNKITVSASLVFNTIYKHKISGNSVYVLVPCNVNSFTFSMNVISTNTTAENVSILLSNVGIKKVECAIILDDISLYDKSCYSLNPLITLLNSIPADLRSLSDTYEFTIDVTNNQSYGYLLFKVSFSTITIDYHMDPNTFTSDFFEITPTKDYALFEMLYFDMSYILPGTPKIELGKYCYKVKDDNTRIRYTTITLNDLVYDGTSDTHRLFLKDNCYVPYTIDNNAKEDGFYALTLYYRPYSHDNTVKSKKYVNSLWEFSKYRDYNSLHLHLGPSFIIEKQ